MLGRRDSLERPDETSPSAGHVNPEPFRIEIHPGHGLGVVLPIGELDLATAGSLRDVMIEHARREPEVLVIDLGRLSFMDCSGVRILLEAHARARQTDRRVEVVCPRGQVRRLLSVSAADLELDLVEDPGQKAAAP